MVFLRGRPYLEAAIGYGGGPTAKSYVLRVNLSDCPRFCKNDISAAKAEYKWAGMQDVNFLSVRLS